MLTNLRETAAILGLSAVLLALGFAAAVALPPGFVGVGASATFASVPPGQLALSVSMNNGTGVSIPVAGSQVRVSQTVVHGITLLAETNDSGDVEMTLPAGQYAVSVYDQRFSFETGAPIEPGRVTQLQVQVNRTSFVALWVEAQDSSTTGQLETWNQVEVAVPTSGGIFVIASVGEPNYIPFAFGQPVDYSSFKFPANVFLQAVELQSNGDTFGPSGPETQAAVISQVENSGDIWLVLRPLAPLYLSGASYLGVTAYEAGGNVIVPVA